MTLFQGAKKMNIDRYKKIFSRLGILLFSLFLFSIQGQSHAGEEKAEAPLKGVVLPMYQSKLGFEQAGIVEELPLEGKRVEKGEVLARMNDVSYQEKLIRSKALLSKARLTLEQANHERAKVGRLLDQKVVSEMGIKEAEFSVIQAQAGVDQAGSDVRLAEKAVRDCKMKAPFAGVVVSVAANLGEYVQAGAEMLQLADLSRLELGIDLQPREASRLKEGQTGEMFADGQHVGLARLRVVLPLVDGASGLQRTIWSAQPMEHAVVSGRYVTLQMGP